MKKLLSIAVAFAMMLVMLPSVITTNAQTKSWGQDYDTATEFTISGREELYAFRDMVNSGKNFTGKTVTLAADIDLASQEWTPIGTKNASFNGTFHGNGKTVKNLVISDETLDYAGFFGYTQGGSNVVISDLTIENVTIHANHLVGGLGGYMVTRTVNCNIIGDITINGHFAVGGLAGDHYSNIVNSHVNGNENSSINGMFVNADSEGDNIGGLVGLRGEGQNLIQKCSVSNVKITGTRKLGGLIGAAFLSNSIEECDVRNVVIETNATADYASANQSSMGLGGLVGTFNNHTPVGHITGSTTSNIAFVIPEELKAIATAGYMYGLSRAANGATPVLENNIVSGSNTGSNNAKDDVRGIATYYPRVEPNCTEAGNIEYWVSVSKYYKDALLTEEITEADTILSPLGHKIEKAEEKAPSCKEEGNIAYWHCEVCDKYFADEWLTDEITLEDTVLEKTEHSQLELIHVKAASCTEAGYTGDLVCTTCKEVIAAGKVIPMREHNYVDGICSECQEPDPNYVQNNADGETPKTGDEVNLCFLMLMMLTTAFGITQLYHKKKASE